MGSELQRLQAQVLACHPLASYAPYPVILRVLCTLRAPPLASCCPPLRIPLVASVVASIVASILGPFLFLVAPWSHVFHH